jgi:hypothetical protein
VARHGKKRLLESGLYAETKSRKPERDNKMISGKTEEIENKEQNDGRD